MSQVQIQRNYRVISACRASKGDNVWEQRLGRDGRIYCTCPAWKWSREGQKGCKHVRRIAPDYKYEGQPLEYVEEEPGGEEC